MEFIKIGGKNYIFNLRKICDFIYKETGRDTKETEILDSFNYEEGAKALAGKTVRELTMGSNGQESIVYDLIKIVLIQVIAFDSPDDIDLEDLPFGTKIAFNTLLAEGFLIEKK